MGKKILILSGGGSHGSYEVGAIRALTEAGKTWDIIVGVSVGAINGLQMSMYSPISQNVAAVQLENFWLTKIKGNESIYKPWHSWKYVNYLYSLFKGSLNDTAPLKNLLDNNFDKQKFNHSSTKLYVGTLNLVDGKYYTIDCKEKNIDTITTWVLGSASMPVLFKPIKIDDGVFVDGGVRRQIPFNDILKFEDISSVDIILADAYKETDNKSTKSFSNVLDVGARCFEVCVNQIYLSNLDLVNYIKTGKIEINIYSPQNNLDFDAFDFSQQNIKKAIDLGYTETREKISENAKK